jgi:hypothetical protein
LLPTNLILFRRFGSWKEHTGSIIGITSAQDTQLDVAEVGSILAEACYVRGISASGIHELGGEAVDGAGWETGEVLCLHGSGSDGEGNEEGGCELHFEVRIGFGLDDRVQSGVVIV